MYEFLDDPAFRQCVQDKEFYHFKNTNMPTVTWDDVFVELEKSAHTGTLNYRGKDQILWVLIRRAHNIKHVKGLVEKYKTIRPDLVCSAHCYVSFSSIATGLGRHKSKSDVLFWEIIGDVQWTIETKFQGDITFKMSPGDVIYVPSGMHHHVIPLSPRAGISLGLDHTVNGKFVP